MADERLDRLVFLVLDPDAVDPALAQDLRRPQVATAGPHLERSVVQPRLGEGDVEHIAAGGAPRGNVRVSTSLCGAWCTAPGAHVSLET